MTGTDDPSDGGEAGTSIRPHLIWNVQQIMSHIGPYDMTDSELLALSEVLMAPHARWLAWVERPSGRGRPPLQLVGRPRNGQRP
jgi:hypothetical protein